MIDDMLRAMSAIGSMQGNLDDRKLDRTKVGKLTISTVFTTDMGYETAILDANGVHPVERYIDREAAIQGHASWIKKAETLTEVTKLGYGELEGKKTIQLAV